MINSCVGELTMLPLEGGQKNFAAKVIPWSAVAVIYLALLLAIIYLEGWIWSPD